MYCLVCIGGLQVEVLSFMSAKPRICNKC